MKEEDDEKHQLKQLAQYQKGNDILALTFGAVGKLGGGDIEGIRALLGEQTNKKSMGKQRSRNGQKLEVVVVTDEEDVLGQMAAMEYYQEVNYKPRGGLLNGALELFKNDEQRQKDKSDAMNELLKNQE